MREGKAVEMLGKECGGAGPKWTMRRPARRGSGRHRSETRQYVVSPICRNMDLTAKLGKTINLICSITKMQKETQHGKYNLCRDGCPQGHLFSLLLQII